MEDRVESGHTVKGCRGEADLAHVSDDEPGLRDLFAGHCDLDRREIDPGDLESSC
jgi:hypothetical protein